MNGFADQPQRRGDPAGWFKLNGDSITELPRDRSSSRDDRFVGLHRAPMTAENSLGHRRRRPGFGPYNVAQAHPFHHGQETDHAEL